MEKTIEATFFKAFEFGGFVDNCIDYVQIKYDLGYKDSKNSKKKTLSERGKQFYFDELPKIIKTRFEAFDSRVIETLHSPLIDEIEQNLQGCQNAVERDSYIFSLITPFAKLSSIIHPIAEIDNLKKRISDIEKDIEYWNKENPDEQLKDMAVAATGTPREQLEACREEIDRLNWQVERKEEVSNKFVNLICGNILEDGTVEDCLCAMLGIMGTYSDRLFAMLIQHGIDIRTYQKKAGIYLKQDWLITDIYFHVGSMELAQHYIDKLHDEQPADEQSQQETQHAYNAQQIPEQLNTDKAKQYFEKAIELELMDNCFRWKKGLQMLSCFAREMSLKLDLNKASNSDGTKRISWKPFEELFGIEHGKLRLNYNDIQKTGQNPSESNLIDKVFE